MQGMTVKQFQRRQFFDVLDRYREVCATKPLDQQAFVALSIAIHIAKAGVPKNYWPLVRRAFRGE